MEERTISKDLKKSEKKCLAKASYKVDSLLDQERVSFNHLKWLLSALFLPKDIKNKIEISETLYIIPLADIKYEYKNSWKAKIGTFKREKYNKDYNTIRKRKDAHIKAGRSNRASQIQYPNRKDPDYWSWKKGQGTYTSECKFMNCVIYQNGKLSGLEGIVLSFIEIYAIEIFRILDQQKFKELGELPEKSDTDIIEIHLEDCFRHALKTTPYPGDEQREIKTNLELISYTISKKYLPIYIMEYTYKGKKFVNCCDAITGNHCIGPRPRSNFLDEILFGLAGLIAIIVYFTSQKTTGTIVLLLLGIIGCSYVIASFVRELMKASKRKKMLKNQYLLSSKK